MAKCHHCKTEDKKTTKRTLRIELKHETLVPLTMTVPLCVDCVGVAVKGYSSVRNTRIVLND